MKQTRITIIGCGNMGRSLIGGLIANGQDPSTLRGADPDEAQRRQLQELFGIGVEADNAAAIRDADVVVLAVKPQSMKATLTDSASALRDAAPLILSVAAGVRITAIQRWLGRESPVVRVMPNTPALIGAGAAALFASAGVTRAQREVAEHIMRSVGLALWIDDEDLMDVVTALSGSGPAYFFLLMEALENAATARGLPAQQARLLTLETALGAAKMAMESSADAGTLRRQVTSPGGTTEAALRVLQDGGFDKLFRDAVAAATDRSRELARTFGDD